MYGGPPARYNGSEATSQPIYGFRPRPSGALLDSLVAIGQQMASEARPQAGQPPRTAPSPWT
eukprot:13858632-Heterocapsa_arctica.AAC.1